MPTFTTGPGSVTPAGLSDTGNNCDGSANATLSITNSMIESGLEFGACSGGTVDIEHESFDI
jgi:hypothetical protein